MGAIKVALGDAGRDLTSLAAADYFFRNRYRRAYFKHFTNLVPMERSGSIRKSMDTAERVLRRGPQHGGVPGGDALGHRRDGRLPPQPRATWRCGPRWACCPRTSAGTFEALPKGAAVPRARELTRVVRAVPVARMAGDADRRAARTRKRWRLVAAFTQRVVENLRDGVATALDVDAARAAWDGQRAGPGGGARRRRRRRVLRSVP